MAPEAANVAAELRVGRLANIEAVLAVHESEMRSGAAAGFRAVDVDVWGGIGVRIYPDRGLDLGQAWFHGVPLAWVSRVGEAGPLERLDATDWGNAFGGGLMTTCGLRNVGMPSEGHGLHGTYSHLAATGLATDRFVSDAEAGVVASGTVEDAAPPAALRVDRTIRTLAGTGRLEIDDVTTNIGTEVAEAPLLYHFNFGYPLWADPALLEMPAVATVARDAASEAALESWNRPPPVETAPERVLEHELHGEDEWAWARITNGDVGIAVTLRWERSGLPRLNQWVDPNPGTAVLGVEPANCSTRGRSFERAAGTLPHLAPGERRRTRLVVEAEAI